MEKEKSPSEKATSFFLKGYNCAQSVLITMAEHWNIKNELIPKIATGFGAGIGRCGSVCGALTGGVMALGVKHGTNESAAEKRLKAYTLANKLFRRFEKKHGTVLCRELIGYDLSKPEESIRAHEAKVFEEKCTNFVESTVEILLKLDEQSS